MDVNKLKKTIRDKFCRQRVLVIGDVMVDEYVTGRVGRLSPEAPIPVLNPGSTQCIAGGASNVACNIAVMGGQAAICGVIGADAAGSWLKEHLCSRQIDTGGLLTETGRPTTVKRRFATKSQQLLRVDIEASKAVGDAARRQMLLLLEQTADSTDAVILSDYQKGVLFSVDFIRQVIRICREHRIVAAVDSKSPHIEAFAHADFVKPNHLELEQAAGIRITDENKLDEAGSSYLERCGAKALLVTRGAEGISVFEKGKPRRDYPARNVQVYDVTGAGDTVISTVTLALASGMTLEEAVVLGNAAAGIVISKAGTAAAAPEELIRALECTGGPGI